MMKRLSFFMAIFCVFLIVFLVFTGQIGNVFRGGNGGDGDSSWQVPTSDQPNFFRHTSFDHAGGRERFTVSGNLPGAQDLAVRIDRFDGELNLEDAVLDVPIWQGDEDLEPSQRFIIRATRLNYRRDSSEVRLSEKVVGEGAEGIGRFETESLEVQRSESGDIRIHGEEAVTYAYPGIDFHGQNGLTALIQEGTGLESVTLQPPVAIALEGKTGSGLLGLGESQAIAPSATEEDRIYLLGKGPVTVHKAENRVSFEGEVVIFLAPAHATLDPPPEVPDSHFSCESLELSLSSQPIAVTRAVARRGNEPVRAHLEPGYVVSGDLLEWEEQKSEALLTGAVEIEGDLGRFRARRARLFLQENRCVLEEDVRGTVNAAELQNPEADSTPRYLASSWQMSADRAEISYEDPEGEDSEKKGALRSLSRFLAESREPNGVEIVEDHPDGARLLGSRLRYDRKQDALIVEPPARAASPVVQPVFTEGRSRIAADRIQLQLDQRLLFFSGSTRCVLYSLPELEGEDSPRWLEGRGPDDHVTLECSKLRLNWDELRSLKEIVAWHGETPLRFESIGTRAYRVSGERFTWDRDSQVVTLTGTTARQRIDLSEDTSVEAGSIVFHIDRSVVEAHEQVAVRVGRSVIVEDIGTASAREIQIESDHLEVDLPPNLREPRSESTSETPTILAARAWSEDGRDVRISDGVFSGVGQKLRWDARIGQLFLEGDRRQLLRYQSPHGPDEVTAQKIVVYRHENRAVLSGQVEGQLHQGSVRAGRLVRPTRSTPQEDDLVWQLAAGRLEVEFPSEATARGNRFGLKSVVATKDVVVENKASAIRFQGRACSWDDATQRLRVYSPEKDEGVQTLYHGHEPRDEIVAREIVLVRSPSSLGNSDRLLVFFEDVFGATFHVREPKRREVAGMEVPTALRLQTDNLLVSLRRGERIDQALREARAWKNVNFKGGRWQILAEQAIYRHDDRMVIFRGEEGQPPQVVQGGTRLAVDPLILQRTEGEFRVTNPSGGNTVTFEDLKPILEMLDKDERRPEK